MIFFFYILLQLHFSQVRLNASTSPSWRTDYTTIPTFSTNTNRKVSTTPLKPSSTTIRPLLTPTEANSTSSISVDSSYCPFGNPLSPAKSCLYQSDCQSTMRQNRYCSEKGICCVENPNEEQSLCYDRRLPLFGEQFCKEDSDCDNEGALCKSGHCCPNFRFVANEQLYPPTHFYSSNFSCSPELQTPPGFQFAYCSSVTNAITYVGILNKCGSIQQITRNSKCHRDSDCYPRSICVWIVDSGQCFEDPEMCSRNIAFNVVTYSCYAALLFMIICFVSREFYLNPETMSKIVSSMYFWKRDVTEETKELPVQEKEIISNDVERFEAEDLRKLSALEVVLKWMGLVVVREDEDENSNQEVLKKPIN